MTKHTRKLLFCWLSLLFVLIGTTVVLYADGWRISRKKFSLVKIGAVYVRSFPETASVILDETQIMQKPSLFGSGFFANNILPDVYAVSVNAEGYYSWQKKIEILPSLITQLKYVTLVPIDGESVTNEAISEFWLAGNTLVTKNSKGILTADGRPMSGNEVIAFSSEETYIITRSRQRGQLTLEEIGAGTAIHFTSSSSNITIVPEQSQPTLVAPLQNAISIITIAKNQKVTTVQTGATPSAIATSPRLLAWAIRDPVKDISRIYLYNLLTQSTSSESYLFPGTIVKLEFSRQGMLGVLQNKGDAYILNPNTGIQRVLANDVRDFIFTKDGSSVAALEYSGIEILSFSSPEEYRRFTISDAPRIKSITWYHDGHHLFLHYPEKIVFLDLEDVGKENLITAAETTYAKYNSSTNELYYIEQGILMKKIFPK